MTPLGRVEGARVTVAEPPGVFDRAALAALDRWRYNTDETRAPVVLSHRFDFDSDAAGTARSVARRTTSESSIDDLIDRLAERRNGENARTGPLQPEFVDRNHCVREQAAYDFGQMIESDLMNTCSEPGYVEQEFEDYLKGGRIEHGFLRVRCDSFQAEHLVAFSCKKRGFCPSCGARRMAESAALLVDEVFPEQPVRQWVLSVPFPLRFLFASRSEVMDRVLGIVYRCIARHLIKKAGFSRKTAQTGAVRLIQRFGSALNLNLNVHFHMLFLDGVYIERPDGSLRFRWVKAPASGELARLTQAPGAAHRPLPRTPGVAGTGCGEQLLGWR